MTTVSRVSLWLMFLSRCCLLSASEAEENVTAALGDDVTLPCPVPSNIHVLGVQWSRLDLEPKYVCLYRDGKPDPADQHQSFRGRVELQDSDPSLILKNVTRDDKGIYKCRVMPEETNRSKRDLFPTEPMSTIILTVGEPGHTAGETGGGDNKDGGDKRGNVGLVAAGICSFCLVLVSVGFLIYRKRSSLLKQRYQEASAVSA